MELNEKWIKLIEQFVENGCTPQDIQRIVMVYEMAKENDEALKKMNENENHH